MGKQRGEAPDMEGTGRRNAHLLAIAPSNSSIICGTTIYRTTQSKRIYTQN